MPVAALDPDLSKEIQPIEQPNLKGDRDPMSDLTQTISNLVGILLGLVGVVGVGYFICAPRHVA